MQERQYDKLIVKIYGTRDEMGKAAAAEAAAAIRDVLKRKEECTCVFAAAPSQNEFLAALTRETDVAWQRVNAFHLDEYMCLPESDTRSFVSYLNQHIFNKVPFRSVHRMDGMADGGQECSRYAEQLEKHPVDIVLMGIGENGHIAFNDPPVADFADPYPVKMVELEEACRQQQVNDGCFASLDEVPTHALTMTIPALLKAEKMFCVVPGIRKAEAAYNSLNGPIATSCPASILRTKTGATMYLDADAASKL